MEAHRLDDAIPEFQQGLNIDPDSAAGHYFLGNAFRAAKRPQEAADQYLAALRLNPNYPEAQSALAMAISGKSSAEESLHNLGQLAGGAKRPGGSI